MASTSSKPHRLPPMAETNNKLMEVIISPSVSDMESKLELFKSQSKPKQVHSISSRKALQIPKRRGSCKSTVARNRKSTSPGMSQKKDELEKPKSSVDLLGTRLKAVKLRREKIVSDFWVREQIWKKQEQLKKSKDSLLSDFSSKDTSRDDSVITLPDITLTKENRLQTLPLVDIPIVVIDKQDETETTGKTKGLSGVGKPTKADIHRDKSDASLRKKHDRRTKKKEIKNSELSYTNLLPPLSSRRMHGGILRADDISLIKRSDFKRRETDLPETNSLSMFPISGLDITVGDISKGADKLRKLFMENREKHRGVLNQVDMATQILKLMWNRDVAKERVYTDVEESGIPTSSENVDTSLPSIHLMSPGLESEIPSPEVEARRLTLSFEEDLQGSPSSATDIYKITPDSPKAGKKTKEKHIARKGSVDIDTKKKDVKGRHKSPSATEKQTLLRKADSKGERAGKKPHKRGGSKKDIPENNIMDSRKGSTTYRQEHSLTPIYDPTPEGMWAVANIEGQLSLDLRRETPSRDSLKPRTPQLHSADRDRKSSDLTNESSDSSFASPEDRESSSPTEVDDYKPDIVPITAVKKRYVYEPERNLHTLAQRLPKLSKELTRVDSMEIKTKFAEVKDFHYTSMNETPAPTWTGDRTITGRHRSSTVFSGDNEETTDPKILAQEYIQSKGIYELFQLLTTKLIIETPDNPLDFLIQEVRDILAQEKCKG